MNLKLKALEEKRAEIVCKMEEMVKSIETESRAFSDDEEKEFDDSKKEVEKIDGTIKKTEEFRNMNLIKSTKPSQESALTANFDNVKNAKEEIKTFANYIRNPIRTQTSMSKATER
jgi:HK97 family phage major capsid protein